MSSDGILVKRSQTLCSERCLLTRISSDQSIYPAHRFISGLIPRGKGSFTQNYMNSECFLFFISFLKLKNSSIPRIYCYLASALTCSKQGIGKGTESIKGMAHVYPVFLPVPPIIWYSLVVTWNVHVVLIINISGLSFLAPRCLVDWCLALSPPCHLASSLPGLVNILSPCLLVLLFPRPRPLCQLYLFPDSSLSFVLLSFSSPHSCSLVLVHCSFVFAPSSSLFLYHLSHFHHLRWFSTLEYS